MFNTGENCRRLLVKLFSDKVREIEVICIDDASTDGSYEYIKKSFANEKRLKLLRQKKNSGAASARNRGLEQAKGDLIVFIDSDDMVKADYLTKLQNAMQDKKNSMAVCGIRQKYLHQGKTVDKFTSSPAKRRPGESLRCYALRTMTKGAQLYSSVNKIYRGDIIRKKQVRFHEELDFAEDTTFVLDYLKACSAKADICFIPEVLYIYNYGTNTSVVSESSLEWKNWERNYQYIKNWADDGSEKLLRKLYRRFKVSHAFAVARSAKTREEKQKYLSPLSLRVATVGLKLKELLLRK